MPTKPKNTSTQEDAVHRSRTRGAAVHQPEPPVEDDDFEDELDEDELQDQIDEAVNDASALRALNDPSTRPLGPAPPPLRATLFNPCRWRGWVKNLYQETPARFQPTPT